MRLKPHINAGSVKAVIAFWKQPTCLVLLELTEADRTLHRLVPALLVVQKSWKRIQDLLVQACRKLIGFMVMTFGAVTPSPVPLRIGGVYPHPSGVQVQCSN
ncbi:hypothetical protein O6H91_13G018700 [Diphasiastrum complanatum]|uniref:Uncharacterized protein n=1 Tax=Diphasiastrum complanatum TaxID=34168 RepID=A0ACC2BSM2_DIPCM|nr:hypothetical protein O6H91_13G018700 [Diphasiastrum complanatum]